MMDKTGATQRRPTARVHTRLSWVGAAAASLGIGIPEGPFALGKQGPLRRKSRPPCAVDAGWLCLLPCALESLSFLEFPCNSGSGIGCSNGCIGQTQLMHPDDIQWLNFILTKASQQPTRVNTRLG